MFIFILWLLLPLGKCFCINIYLVTNSNIYTTFILLVLPSCLSLYPFNNKVSVFLDVRCLAKNKRLDFWNPISRFLGFFTSYFISFKVIVITHKFKFVAYMLFCLFVSCFLFHFKVSTVFWISYFFFLFHSFLPACIGYILLLIVST